MTLDVFSMNYRFGYADRMSSDSEMPLQGAKILVAEDDAILAFDISIMLQKAGASILGPTVTLNHTMTIAADTPMSAALLDVSLRGEEVFPAARVLTERGVGVVFYTGYAEVDKLKREWPNAEVLTKPAPPRRLVDAVARACGESTVV